MSDSDYPRRLTEAEIIAGYSLPFESSLLALASRNAMILKWLRELTPLVAKLIAREYAEKMGLPFGEVEGALDQLTDAADLDWLWTRYEKDIRDSDFIRHD
jgi:hypothetical protein